MGWLDEWKSTYGKDDKQKLICIIDCFKNHVDAQQENLPPYFKLEKNTPLEETAPEDLYPEKWMHRLGQGFLRHVAKELVSSICQYQLTRHKNISNRFKGFYKNLYNDPVNMFLEELKGWLFRLSNEKTTQQMLQELKSRKHYIRAILQATYGDENRKELFSVDNELFDNKTSVNMNIKRLLVQLINMLDKIVIPDVKIAISRLSAREQLELLIQSIEDVMISAISFLYYSYNNKSTVDNFNFTDIISDTSFFKENKVFVKSIHGQLMQSLLREPSFKNAFPVSYIPNGKLMDNGDEILSLTHYKLPYEIENDVSLFFKKDKFHIPSQLCPLFEKKGKALFLDNWVLHPNSGVWEILEKVAAPQQLSYSLLTFYGLLNYLAVYREIFVDAYELAGEGGNLMVYGVVASKMERLLNAYKGLHDRVKKVSETLYKWHEAFLEKDIDKKGKNFKSWQSNYKIGKEHYRRLHKSLKKCGKHQSIIIESCRKNPYERYQHAQRLIQRFVRNVDILEQQTRQAIGTQSSPPQLQPGSKSPIVSVTEVTQIKEKEERSQPPSPGHTAFFSAAVSLPYTEDDIAMLLSVSNKRELDIYLPVLIKDLIALGDKLSVAIGSFQEGVLNKNKNVFIPCWLEEGRLLLGALFLTGKFAFYFNPFGNNNLIVEKDKLQELINGTSDNSLQFIDVNLSTPLNEANKGCSGICVVEFATMCKKNISEPHELSLINIDMEKAKNRHAKQLVSLRKDNILIDEIFTNACPLEIQKINALLKLSKRNIAYYNYNVWFWLGTYYYNNASDDVALRYYNCVLNNFTEDEMGTFMYIKVIYHKTLMLPWSTETELEKLKSMYDVILYKKNDLIKVVEDDEKEEALHIIKDVKIKRAKIVATLDARLNLQQHLMSNG